MPCLALSLVVLLVLPLQLVEAASSTVEVEVAADVYIDAYDGELDLSISDPDLNFKHGSDPILIVGKKKESVEYGRTAFTDDWHEGCGIFDAECVGLTGANEYRILLRPSLDGISGVVMSAKIVLTLKQMDPDHDVAILAYPLVANFNEAEATWIYRDSGVEWAIEGGDYNSSGLLEQVVVEAGSAPGTVVEVDVTDYVRAVKQGRSHNYGIILIPGATLGWAEFYSTESSNPKGRPKLVVETSSPGGVVGTPMPTTPPPFGGWTGPVTPHVWYVSVSPSEVTVLRGRSVTVDVGVEAIGVSPTVSLSASGIPPGCAVSFSQTGGPAPLAASLTVSTTASTPEGDYNVTIQAISSSGETRSTVLRLKVVSRPSPDFKVTVRPPGGAVGQGEAAAFKVAVAPMYGFSEPVTVSLLNLPSGCSYTVSGVGVPPFEAWVNVSTSEDTPAGAHNLVVKVAGGGLTKSERFVLVVISAPEGGETSPPPGGPVGGEGAPGSGVGAGGAAGGQSAGGGPRQGGSTQGGGRQRPPRSQPTAGQSPGGGESQGAGRETGSTLTLPLLGVTLPAWLVAVLALGLILIVAGIALRARGS